MVWGTRIDCSIGHESLVLVDSTDRLQVEIVRAALDCIEAVVVAVVGIFGVWLVS